MRRSVWEVVGVEVLTFSNPSFAVHCGACASESKAHMFLDVAKWLVVEFCENLSNS